MCYQMFQNADDGKVFVDDLLGDVERRRRVECNAVGVVAAEEHHLVPVGERQGEFCTAALTSA